MAGGPAARPRGAGESAAENSEGAGRPPRDTVIEGTRMGRGRHVPASLFSAALALLAGSCAGAHLRDGQSAPSSAVVQGYRALFHGDADGPDGKGRFRLAVAILPPDRIRLEFFGPVGGPRAILTASSDQTVVLLPSARSYERSPSSAEVLDRILGIPVDVSGLVALLTGRPMCTQESMHIEVMTRPAATFGRTLSWYQITCPPADLRYQ